MTEFIATLMEEKKKKGKKWSKKCISKTYMRYELCIRLPPMRSGRKNLNSNMYGMGDNNNMSMHNDISMDKGRGKRRRIAQSHLEIMKMMRE